MCYTKWKQTRCATQNGSRQDVLHKIEADQEEVVSMWVPGHVGIRGNETADRAAKEALEKEPIDDLMPFSDLRPLTVAKYIHQVW